MAAIATPSVRRVGVSAIHRPFNPMALHSAYLGVSSSSTGRKDAASRTKAQRNCRLDGSYASPWDERCTEIGADNAIGGGSTVIR